MGPRFLAFFIYFLPLYLDITQTLYIFAASMSINSERFYC